MSWPALDTAYERLGITRQLDLYYGYGGGTLNKRPAVHPLDGSDGGAFALLPPDGIKIKWYCHRTGEHGDLYDFLKTVLSKSEAYSLIGLSGGNVVEPMPKARSTSQPAIPPKKDTLAKAKTLFRQSVPATQDVADYLKTTRGITIPVPPSIRAVGNTMFSIVSDANGDFQAGHQTALYKIPNKKRNRFNWGPVGGGSVHLGNITDDGICVTEGIEDGLAVTQATGLPSWAALSAGGMKKLILPANAKKVFIFSDSDAVKKDNPQHVTSLVGQKAAKALAERLVNEGRNVTIVYPVEQTDRPDKVDFNDLLKQDKTGQSIRDRLETATPFTPSKSLEYCSNCSCFLLTISSICSIWAKPIAA